MEKRFMMLMSICKILVTYPSLEFKENELRIQKDKEPKFSEYFGADTTASVSELSEGFRDRNISLSNCIESNDVAENE